MATMDSFLKAAIEEARHGLREGGIPIGSVLVHAGKIIGRVEVIDVKRSNRGNLIFQKQSIS